MAEVPQTITLGNQVFIRTTDMIVKTLSQTIPTTTLTLHDEAGVNYQVPTGKVFKALEITLANEGTGGLSSLWDSASADSATGTLVIIAINLAGSSVLPTTNINIDFAVDRFVNGQINAASGSMLIVGIEMDA